MTIMNVDTLAEYLMIPASSVYRLVRERAIPYYKIGRLIRFRQSDIDKWLEGLRVQSIDPNEVAKTILKSIY